MSKIFTAKFTTRTDVSHGYGNNQNNNGSLNNFFADDASYNSRNNFNNDLSLIGARNNNNNNNYNQNNNNLSSYSNQNNRYGGYQGYERPSRERSSRNLVKSAIETTSVIGNKTIVNGMLVNSEEYEGNGMRGSKFSFEVNYPDSSPSHTNYNRTQSPPNSYNNNNNKNNYRSESSEWRPKAIEIPIRTAPAVDKSVRFNEPSSSAYSNRYPSSDFRYNCNGANNSSYNSRYTSSYANKPITRPTSSSYLNSSNTAADVLTNRPKYGISSLITNSSSKLSPTSPSSTGATAGSAASSAIINANMNNSNNTTSSSSSDRYKNLTLSKQHSTDSTEFTNTLADNELVKAQTIVVIEKDPHTNKINQIKETFRLNNNFDNLGYDQISEYKSNLNDKNEPVIKINESIKFSNISAADLAKATAANRARSPSRDATTEKVSFRNKLLESSIETTSVINDTTTVVEAPFNNYLSK